MWEVIPILVDSWVKIAAPVASGLQREAASCYPRLHAGYYLHPDQAKVAIFSPLLDEDDLTVCKQAAERVVGKDAVCPERLAYAELADLSSRWIKVAYSDNIRRLGELLNFFPGQYPGGIPNHPSPVAAMLTSGLLGAGLGWGAGKLVQKVLPDRFGEHLGRTGAVLGGLLGASPGLGWMATNRISGRGLNDPSLLAAPKGSQPPDFPEASNGRNRLPPPAPQDDDGAIRHYLEHLEPLHAPHGIRRACDQLAEIELGGKYQKAVQGFVKRAYGDTFSGYNALPPATPLDINVNHLGQLLWEGGASPQLTGTTMGAMYAAQQFPDDDARPGLVTLNQLGRLAQHATGDYAKGLLVGGVINHLVGTPYSAPAFGVGAAALGVLEAVVPRLFGY